MINRILQVERSNLIIEEDGDIIEQIQEYNPDTGDMSIEVIIIVGQISNNSIDIPKRTPLEIKTFSKGYS